MDVLALALAGVKCIVLGLAASFVAMFSFASTLGIGLDIGEEHGSDAVRVLLLLLCSVLTVAAALGVSKLGLYWFSS